MKSIILVIAVGALLGACTVRSETTVVRPAPQPAIVVAPDSSTTTTTRDNTGATTSTTVYRTN